MENVMCKNQYEGNGFALFNGDSCEVMKAIPDNSMHYSILSPPFAQLYVYSNSVRGWLFAGADIYIFLKLFI